MNHLVALGLIVAAYFSGLTVAHADFSLSRLQAYLINYHYVPVSTRIDDDSHQHFEARINGHTVRLIVDSGAGFTTLSRACARRLGLPVQDTGRFSIGAGGAELGTTGEALIAGFTIGASAVINPGVIHVLPDSDRIPGAEGLFGFDSLWLNSAIVLIGGDGFLFRPGIRGVPPRLDDYMRGKGFMAVPLTLSQNRLLAAGTLGGRPFRAEIDSGAAGSCFDLAYLKAMHVPTRWVPMGMRGVDGAAVGLRAFKTDDLTLGRFTPPPDDMLAVSSPLLTLGRIDALIGFDFLAAHQAILDLGSCILWLK